MRKRVQFLKRNVGRSVWQTVITILTEKRTEFSVKKICFSLGSATVALSISLNVGMNLSVLMCHTLHILQGIVKRSMRVVAIAVAAVFITTCIVIIIIIILSPYQVSLLKASNQLMYLKPHTYTH